MGRNVRKQTFNDWAEGKLLEVEEKRFILNTKGTNNKTVSNKSKFKTADYKTIELADGVLEQIRAKQKGMHDAASYEAFISLTNILSQKIKNSHKIISFIFSESETYENLFSAQRTPIAVIGAPFLSIDLGNRKFPANKILAIRSTYKKLSVGIKNYSRILPISSPDYKNIKEDIEVETESYCAYRNFLRNLKQIIEKIFERLYESVDFNPTNPTIHDYLNLFEHYFSSETYFDFQTDLNSLKSLEHLDISGSTIFNIQHQFLQYHIKKFKQLLNVHITTCNDCTEHVITETYYTLKRIYKKSRNQSNYMREELYYDQVFIDGERLHTLLKELLKHFKNSYGRHLIPLEHSYIYFERELLYSFTEFDTQLTSNTLTPIQIKISNQSAAYFRDDMMEEFDESFGDFYSKWYLKLPVPSGKLSQEDFIRDLIKNINKHFTGESPSGGMITVHDRKGKPHSFTIDYYGKYVLPFFQYAINSLTQQLKELQSGNTTTKHATSISKKSKIKVCETSYLYKPQDMTDEEIEKKLTKVCELFIEKGVIDNATEVAIFVGLMTGKICDRYITWLWGAKDLREFILQMNSNGFPGGASHWETSCVVYRNKKGNKFEPRNLETNNSKVHPSRQPLINKAIQILKNK